MKYNLVYAEFYSNYINLAKGESIKRSLLKSTKEFFQFLEQIPEKKYDYAYAEGKWTIKEVLQHVIDAERVFSYRITSIARFDATPLPGFNENLWAANAGVSEKKWKDLVKEFKLLRKSNLLMINSLQKSELASVGTASNQPISTAALCFIIGGHVQHHMKVLKERYL